MDVKSRWSLFAEHGTSQGLRATMSGRFLGAIFGGAIGDALGADIEFWSWPEIRDRYGERGATGFTSDHPVITDDTQMTLFTMEGLIRADIARCRFGQADPALEVRLAYQRWLHTQEYSWKEAAGAMMDTYPEPDGWLVGQPEMHAIRAPGKTCLRALTRIGRGEAPGTVDRHINDSKGCGGVMRVAPAALWSRSDREVFRIGALSAAITHGHPSGYLSAGAFAVMVLHTVWGGQPSRAIGFAMNQLREWEGHEETTSALERALELADKGTPSPEDIERELGGGWTGEQALAIAVCAVMSAHYGGDFDEAVRIAVNHSGDSDSTGSLAGTLAGAAIGFNQIPERWLPHIAERYVVARVTEDAIAQFHDQPPTDQEFLARYPVRER